MNKSGIQRAAIFFLLAYAPFGVMPSAAGYLCVGVDGHVAVETGENGTCGELDAADVGHSSAALTAVYGGDSDDHCGPCVDTPLDLKAVISDSTAKSMASLTQLPVGYLPSLTPLPVLVRCVTFSVTATPAIPPAVLTAGVLRL